MAQIDWINISAHIATASRQAFKSINVSSVAGGCISQSWKLQGESRSYFVKVNRVTAVTMFSAELAGLEILAATATIKVPLPLCVGTTKNHAYLVLEYLELKRSAKGSAELLGEQLADLHRCTAEYYGWLQDNTIGSTPQINSKTESWIIFWTKYRLGFQLKLAANNGHQGYFQQRGQQLLSVVDQLLAGHKPQPSLLHGDLWSGNVAVMAEGHPVIFDPAAYYGDREVDLAMTELFSGFSKRFYHAYQSAWPLAAGYQQRKVLYNLYHILNHLNIFGGSYKEQAEAMIDRLLAEVGL